MLHILFFSHAITTRAKDVGSLYSFALYVTQTNTSTERDREKVEIFSRADQFNLSENSAAIVGHRTNKGRCTEAVFLLVIELVIILDRICQVLY